MIAARFKHVTNKVFEPWGRLFIRAGLSPNQVTLLGLFMGILACGVLIWTRNIPLFTVCIIVAALFDAADGIVARLTNRETKFGSYLDAVCDRLFEGILCIAVAYVSGYWVLVFFLYMGFAAISYSKARAALEVSVSNAEWPDFMERGERIGIFVVGLCVADVTRIEFLGRDLFFWTCVFLVCAVYATVFQRVLRAKRFIQERE